MMTYLMTSIPVPNSREYREFVEQEKRNEAQRLQSITDSYAAERTKVYRGVLKQMATVWNQPLHKLHSAWSSQNPKVIAGLYFDVLLRQTAEDGSAIREGEQSGDEAWEAFLRFTQELPDKTGFRLSPTSGLPKFKLFTLVQTQVGKHLCNETNMTIYFNAMKDAEAFAPEDLAWNESWTVREPEPVKKLSLDDIDGSTPEGRQAERELVQEQVNESNLPLQRLWSASLAENFDGFTLSKEDWDFIITLFQRHNLDPNSPASYDKVRRIMCRLHRWDARRLLTIEDLREQCVDRLPMENRDIRHVVWNATNKGTLIELLEKHGIPLA